MPVNLDGLRAAKESLVRAMDFEGAAHVRDAIVALGGACDQEPPAPAADSSREGDLSLEVGVLDVGFGFVVTDPKSEGRFAAVLYSPEHDRFFVYRGATAEVAE